MSAKLHIFKTALDDLQDALDSKEVNERLDFIAKYPEAAAARVKGFRSASLKKFPYTIYYDFEELHNTVYVSAVLHDKRDRSTLVSRR
jgi:mRNA-degrading endonuclease RelE of RelBE toxin-antitoxin system